MTNELTDDELREAIVRHEWDQFQRTNNEGGRAACQGNWPVFHQMRLAQFLTWERPLLTSYAADLDAADHVGRNLVTEKYGRMMASTAPEDFTKNIEPYIPRLSEERVARQEQVIAQQVAWAKDFRERYPKLGEAMRTPSFHYLFWSFFVCGFQTAFIMLHLPAFVVDAGMSANIGMTAVAMIGLFNIFGSFLSGWLGGLYSKKWLLAWIYALRIVAILALLLFPLSQLTLYVFAAVMGLLWLGTVPLTSGLVGHIFGLRYMGMLYGIVFLGHQIGGFLGAWLGGRIFDLSGSYLMAWWLSIALSVMAAALSLPVREAPLLRAEAR